MDALRQVVAVARRTRNDVLLRTVLRELRKSTKKESCRRAPEAEQLRTAARQELQRTIAARQERRELERRAAIEDLAAQTALHEAKRLATDSRRQAMNAAGATRREELERQAASARVRRETRWLQTRYPAALADRLLTWRRGLLPEREQELEAYIRAMLRTAVPAQHRRPPLFGKTTRH